MNRTEAAILAHNSTLLQPGGVPSSTRESQQQWDFPNVWPPLVEMTVTALHKLNTSRTRELARSVAGNFLRNILRSEEDSGNIYEKYNCSRAGRPGGGGEYGVQEGFGWTNGVALSLLSRYPDMNSSSLQITPFLTTISVALSLILVITN